MGRTLIPMTQLILQECDSWKQFRRALRKEEQEVFDELFRDVRRHVAEIAAASRVLPFEAMLMAMLISQATELKRLRQKDVPTLTSGNPTDARPLRDGKER